MNSDTPRTDAKCKDYFTKSSIGTVMQFIPADFARGLERELIEANRSVAKLEKELNAVRKQANDEFDAVITRNMELEQDRARLEQVTSAARSMAYGAPELNMCNYDHEQVRQLNDAMCELFTLLDAAQKGTQ